MRIGERIVALPAREGARAVALGLLAEADDAAERLAAGKGEGPLHDFRVAVRRLRSALRALRPWLEDGMPRRREKKLKRIARSTNAARDAEVQLEWLAAARREISTPSQRAGWKLAVARLEERLSGRPDAVRVARRFHRATAELRRRLDEPGRKLARADDEKASFGAVLAPLVREQARALARRVEAIRDEADQEGAHRARIAAKRLRYLLEPLRGFRRAEAANAVARLKRLQDTLGELNDAHVLAAELGVALEEATAERARRLHAAMLAPGSPERAARARLRSSPRPGLLALVRLVRRRRDALFAEVDRARRAGDVEALAAAASALAAALDAGAPRRGRPRRAAPHGGPPEGRSPDALRRATSPRARAPGVGGKLTL